MSRGRAEIHTLDGHVYYSVYDGTGCDCVPTGLSDEPSRDFYWARCEKPSEHKQVPARLYHFYGGGEAWDTKVCTECKCITGPFYPYPPDLSWSASPEQIRRQAEEWDTIEPSLHLTDIPFWRSWHESPDSPLVKKEVSYLDGDGQKAGCAEQDWYNAMIQQDFAEFRSRYS